METTDTKKTEGGEGDTMTIKKLSKIVARIAEAVESIEKRLDTPTEPAKTQDLQIKHSSYKPKGYVPQNYRHIINEILSPEFGLDCEESPSSMDFTVSIVVPQAYSSLTTQEKQLGVEDIRSRVISRTAGEAGVREWAVKVRENLNRYFTKSGVVSPFTNQVIV